MASRVIHFEIHAGDMERAKDFYAHVFGWTFEDYSAVTGSPYFGVVTGPDGELGINGGLLPRRGDAPEPGQAVNAFVCTIGVDDYDATEATILRLGGTVAMPKTALPGMAWQGYYVDTEGNIIGIHQTDPQAR